MTNYALVNKYFFFFRIFSALFIDLGSLSFIENITLEIFFAIIFFTQGGVFP